MLSSLVMGKQKDGFPNSNGAFSVVIVFSSLFQTRATTTSFATFLFYVRCRSFLKFERNQETKSLKLIRTWLKKYENKTKSISDLVFDIYPFFVLCNRLRLVERIPYSLLHIYVTFRMSFLFSFGFC